MNLFLLLSVQAAAAPAPAPSATHLDPIHFDLATVKPSDPAGCGDPQGSEIVVCARRKPYAYPLEAMAKIYEPKPLRAQIGLGGGATAGVGVQQVGLPQGMKSNRIMVTIKMPF